MEGSGQDMGLTAEEQVTFRAEYPQREFPFYYGPDGKLLPWRTDKGPDASQVQRGLHSFAHVRLWLKVQRVTGDLYRMATGGKKE